MIEHKAKLAQDAAEVEAMERRNDLQQLNDHLRNEDIGLESERVLNHLRAQASEVGSKIKEVDELSDSYEDYGAGIGGFGNNDSGF